MTKQAYKLHSFFDDPKPEVKACSHEGCVNAADYKAPRSRYNLRDYLWFCLDHIRDYNASWNYYQGMNEAEIESSRRSDITWQRPSWPFGAGDKSFQERPFDFIRDPLNIFGDESQSASNTQDAAHWFPPQSEEAKALRLFELGFPLCKKALKVRYLELVKLYHPDLNGGCQAAEEKLKSINHAYEILENLLG